VKIESILRAAVVISVIVLIELLCRLGVIPTSVLLAPSTMVTHGAELLHAGKFNHDIGISLWRSWRHRSFQHCWGLSSAWLFMRCRERAGARAFVVQLLRSTNIHIFIQLSSCAWGRAASDHRDRGVAGRRDDDYSHARRPRPDSRALHKSGLVMRLPAWRSAFFIKLPAALPYLFTGMKLAVAYSFIGVIASEFILSGSGVGYAIATPTTTSRTTTCTR